MKKRLMLIHPPGRVFQRSEERCQSNIDQSTSTSLRACNDLGYCAAVMREKGWDIFLKDYPAENLKEKDFFHDLINFSPDAILLTTTTPTFFDDLYYVEKIRQKCPLIYIIMKGAVFFDPPEKLLQNRQLSMADILIAEEAECVIDQILSGIPREKIPRIFFKDEDKKWVKSVSGYLEENLDRLPFPARDLMNNALYLRPDTGEVQATISTSRGCPSSCTFCLTPVMTGKKVRFRSPENIVAEIKECVEKYNIRNFFFRADTFTINPKLTEKLCDLLEKENLGRKIKWVANSRVDTLNETLLKKMKANGCWLLAIGFESGSQDTLNRIKKRITVSQMMETAELIRKAKIKLFGFFMIGFPWETEKHLQETRECIRKIKPDFLELHIATPFYGTELYKQITAERGISEDIAGHDYFDNTISCTNSVISAEYIACFRKKILLHYHFSFRYLFARFTECMTDYRKFLSYLRFAVRLIRNLF